MREGAEPGRKSSRTVVATMALDRMDLRHTGLTWMADMGVSSHVLQKIAGHADSRTAERYLHPDRREITGAGDKLSEHLRSRSGPALRVVGE